MGFPAVLDMDKICRICLRSSQNMSLIFDERYGEDCISIAAMLTECTMYKVERFDQLPHQICGACLERVHNVFHFKRTCEQSYRTLVGLRSNNCPKGKKFTLVKFENKFYAEKSTQTNDTTINSCKRCDEKTFTFETVKTYRESEYLGSAIICRFCSKVFNRIGYLRTHIAVFHPESGYTPHNQCHICERQFTRREHMRRHLAVIHKIIETADDDISNLEVKDEVNIPDLKRESKTEFRSTGILRETDLLTALKKDRKHTELSNDVAHVANQPNIMRKVNPRPKRVMINCDDEDEKPLSNFLTETPNKNFLEVLLEKNELKTVFNNSKNCATFVDDDRLQEQSTQFVKYDMVSTRNCSQQFSHLIENPQSAPPLMSNDRQHLVCDQCDEGFQHDAALQRHISVHKRSRLFPCRICAKTFRRANVLKTHMSSAHDAAKAMKCDKCDKVFTYITQLKRHEKAKHNERVYKCGICMKVFITKIYLQRHLAIHGKKRYICKECSQSFSTKDELNVHVKSEGHDKPMLCPECGLRCKTSNILTVHMRRHNGEKPFKCKFCSKGFPRMDDLRVHEKYHTGEKSHFCETCGKGFQRKYNLTIHLRVHTGEKPYKCPHCPQAFAQGNDLKAHIRRHTGERFRCEICNAAFLQGYQIRQHKLLEHGIKEVPPTQRVAKFTSPEEQAQQIKQNLQNEKAKTISHSDLSSDAQLQAFPPTANPIRPITTDTE